jgi:hypothetical protein
LPRSHFDHRGQIGAVVPRTAPGALRQQELLIHIGHDHPLQPMPPGQRLWPMMMQPPHGLADSSVEGWVVQPLQETI